MAKRKKSSSGGSLVDKAGASAIDFRSSGSSIVNEVKKSRSPAKKKTKARRKR